MIDTSWKRAAGSPYWETAGHDRAGMPETAHPVSASYLSSFLFRKIGTQSFKSWVNTSAFKQAHKNKAELPWQSGD